MTDWQEFAACSRADNPDDWDLDIADEMQRERARATCQVCPVNAQCLDYALGDRAKPINLIMAGFAWRWPSKEPLDAVTGVRVRKAQRPVRVRELPAHGSYARYARGCRCPECKAAKRAYAAQRREQEKATGALRAAQGG